MKTETEITENKIRYNNDTNKLTRGNKMKYFSIIFTVMVAALIGRVEDETTGWEYDASTQQAFYMFAHIEVDGVGIDSEDVLGAF